MNMLLGIGALVLLLIGLPLMVVLGQFKPEDTLAKEDRDNNDF
jgi:hypothetical protein